MSDHFVLDLAAEGAVAPGTELTPREVIRVITSALSVRPAAMWRREDLARLVDWAVRARRAEVLLRTVLEGRSYISIDDSGRLILGDRDAAQPSAHVSPRQ